MLHNIPVLFPSSARNNITMFDDIVEVMVENVGLVSDVAMFAAGLETEINLHKLNGF